MKEWEGVASTFWWVYTIDNVRIGSVEGTSFQLQAYVLKKEIPMKITHFNGSRFSNLDYVPHRNMLEVLKWFLTRSKGEWPSYTEQNAIYDTPPLSVQNDDIRLSFIGHATVLIQTQGINILTDPHWSKKAGPFSLLGPHRVHPAGVKFEDLPKVDVVLISHNHYDHMDTATLQKLEQAFKPLFIVPRANEKYLENLIAKERIVTLDWWKGHLFKDCLIMCVPVHHWSSRNGFDKNKALWGGFVIKTNQGSVFFAGDTAFADGKPFERIYKRCGPMRVALLPIGAYEPREIMQPAHMNPEDAVKAHLLLRADYSLAIHFELFAHLTDESYAQPRKDLATALLQYKEVKDGSFRALHVGEHWLINANNI